MKPEILLIQFRDDVSKEHEIKCFVEKSGYKKSAFRIINAIIDDFEDDPNKILDGIKAVIMGASGQYDLSKKPKPLVTAINKTANIFRYILENDFPTLAVCFGNQLIANKLGGVVEAKKEWAETGTKRTYLTVEGQKDPLFIGFPKSFLAQVGHKESIVKLPDGVVLLSKGEICPNHIYRYKKSIYGVQIHPEIDIDALMYRVYTLYPDYAQGKTKAEMRKSLKETPYAHKFLRNFLKKYVY